MQSSAKDLAMFNLAIGSKLRASDLMHLRITDVCSDQNVRDRGVIVQKKTGRPVQFEVTRETRLAFETWIAASGNRDGGYMFPSRLHHERHLSTRQYTHMAGR